jgi:hypothetical protein
MRNSSSTTTTITVTKTADGALVQFSSRELNAGFKATFPKARWSSDQRGWAIPGVRAFSRAEQWAATHAQTAAAAAERAEQQRREAAREAVELQQLAAAALAARRGEMLSTRIQVQGAKVIYDFAYADEAVAIARSLPGAQYAPGSKAWVWTAHQPADVDAIIAGANRIYAIAKRVLEERAQAKAQATAARAATRSARYLQLASRLPAIGQTVRYMGTWVTVESIGKVFHADDSTASISNLVGCEGERVAYVYYREATDAERAAGEAAQAHAQAAAEAARRQQEAIAALVQSQDCPQLGAEPAGEVLWRNDRSALVGYAERVVLTPDGWLWHVTYDGSDGAMWGERNLGHNTRGSRLPATPELIAAIKSTVAALSR